MVFVGAPSMLKPIRFILAGFLALSMSPVLAVPVQSYATVSAYAADTSLGTATQSATLGIGGSATASASLGTLSTSVQGTAIASGNGLTLDYAFTETLGAPNPVLVSFNDPVKGYISYLAEDMYVESIITGSFTLDAADVGYSYALTGAFDQVGTSQMMLAAYLYDMTDGSGRYYLYQYDPVSTDASMGPAAGAQAVYQTQSGSTSGELIAGHSYGYYFSGEIRHYNAAEGETATDARGSFTLSIQGPAPEAVPEPSSLVLCGLGLGGLVWAARKRRASRS